jgi:hypothetical protein
LEPEQWTNRNQEFTQLTNGKQRGPQRNSVHTVYLQLMLVIEYVFTKTAREMAMTTSHQRDNLKIQKPGEVLIF